MKLRKWSEIHNGKKYNTATAKLIADNCYWDGNNFERNGRNRFLLVGKNGNYFSANQTMWQGEKDYLQPLTKEEAIQLYEDLNDKQAIDFEEAFPGTELKEA